MSLSNKLKLWCEGHIINGYRLLNHYNGPVDFKNSLRLYQLEQNYQGRKKVKLNEGKKYSSMNLCNQSQFNKQNDCIKDNKKLSCSFDQKNKNVVNSPFNVLNSIQTKINPTCAEKENKNHEEIRLKQPLINESLKYLMMPPKLSRKNQSIQSLDEEESEQLKSFELLKQKQLEILNFNSQKISKNPQNKPFNEFKLGIKAIEIDSVPSIEGKLSNQNFIHQQNQLQSIAIQETEKQAEHLLHSPSSQQFQINQNIQLPLTEQIDLSEYLMQYINQNKIRKEVYLKNGGLPKILNKFSIRLLLQQCGNDADLQKLTMHCIKTRQLIFDDVKGKYNDEQIKQSVKKYIESELNNEIFYKNS